VNATDTWGEEGGLSRGRGGGVGREARLGLGDFNGGDELGLGGNSKKK